MTIGADIPISSPTPSPSFALTSTDVMKQLMAHADAHLQNYE
jgi:hypothetical protein